MPDHVELRKDLPSGTIIINRPGCRNALTPRSVAELQTAFSDLLGERKIRGVILTGGGDAFCSGTDLVHLNEQMQCPDPESFWQEEVPEFLALIETILRFPKPVIASVSGVAQGSGLALMSACDYVIATASSTFALPEVHHGLVPGFAAPLLVRRTGPGFASRMAFSGKPVDSTTALAVSLIDEIVDADLVWARAQQLVGEFSSGAPTSLQLVRKLLNETISEELFTQLGIGAANTAAARSTNDAARGVGAFVRKKRADWD